MMIVDEIMPKVKAEVRLDKDNKTLWVKTDTLDGYGRVIIEDGSNWCRVFYDGKDEPQTCDTCRFDDRYGDESICKECARHYSDNYAPIEDEPQTDCDKKCVQTEVGCEHTDCAWGKGE